MKFNKALFIAQLVFIIPFLYACSNDSSSNNNSNITFSLDGGAIEGSVDPSGLSPTIYHFDVVTGTPYTVNLVNTFGDAGLYLYRTDPLVDSTATPFGFSWTEGNYETVSFIADANETIYATPVNSGTTTTGFTIEATTNQLAVGEDVRLDSVYGGSSASSDLYYSFDAQIGQTYEVRVQLEEGDVDIGGVWPTANLANSVGSSLNTGTTTESVFFTATGSQRYYIGVSGTNIDSTFNIRVIEVPFGVDLRTEINSVVSDGSTVTVDYTIYNSGTQVFAGDVQVDAWSDSASLPIVGMTGENFTTHSGVTIASLGGKMTSQIEIASNAESGTAYTVVDSLEAVIEGNEANNVSVGTAWEKPLLVQTYIGFDDGTIPAQFTMSGDANWLIDDGTYTLDGTPMSLRSPVIGDDQIACFAVSVYHTHSTRVDFDRKVSSEPGDALRFYIDGVLQDSWSGELPWEYLSYQTDLGLHHFQWCFEKSSSVSAGNDATWIDHLAFSTAPTDLTVNISQASSDGENVTIDYIVSNTSAIVGPFSVQFWSDAPGLPAIGDLGEVSIDIDGLGVGESVSGSVLIPNTAASGTAYAIVDSEGAMAIAESNYNNRASDAWIITLPEFDIRFYEISSNGTEVIVDYEISNTGTRDTAAVYVDFWSDPATVPGVGDTGEVSVFPTGLRAGTRIRDTIVIPNTGASGAVYAVVDTIDAVSEFDESNNVFYGGVWNIPPSAPLVYDFESGVVPSELSLSGSADWTVDGANGAGGSATSLVSGTIDRFEASCISITVLDSSSISFDYKVSSEQGGDFLRFYIDDVEQDTWSGQLPWANASYVVTPGLHEYYWCYSKDGSVVDNADSAWIDNININ